MLLGDANAAMVVADLGKLLGPGGELLDPTRMKRVAFRAESRAKVRDLTGFRKSHSVPDRVNEWARRYVNRAAAADIKADLDRVFDMVREEFGYKRKDLRCVRRAATGSGFIHTPDFEYTVSIDRQSGRPTEVMWRQGNRPAFRGSTIRALRQRFQNVFGGMFDRLVFEFAANVDVAEFVDQMEESPPEGVKVGVASDANIAEIALAGFAARFSRSAPRRGHHSRPTPAIPAACSNSFSRSCPSSRGSGEAKATAACGEFERDRRTAEVSGIHLQAARE